MYDINNACELNLNMIVLYIVPLILFNNDIKIHTAINFLKQISAINYDTIHVCICIHTCHFIWHIHFYWLFYPSHICYKINNCKVPIQKLGVNMLVHCGTYLKQKNMLVAISAFKMFQLSILWLLYKIKLVGDYATYR